MITGTERLFTPEAPKLNPALVAIDWSGVISDDRHVVHQANMRVLADHGFETLAFEDWLSHSAGSAPAFFKERGIEGTFEELMRLYIESLEDVSKLGTRPTQYPDAFEFLRTLAQRDLKPYVVSTHPEPLLHAEAQEYGVVPFLAGIVAESQNKAAAPMRLAEELRVDPDHIIFVGDMATDMQAARVAGIRGIGITTGYHTSERLEAEGAHLIVNSLTELLGEL